MNEQTVTLLFKGEPIQTKSWDSIAKLKRIIEQWRNLNHERWHLCGYQISVDANPELVSVDGTNVKIGKSTRSKAGADGKYAIPVTIHQVKTKYNDRA